MAGNWKIIYLARRNPSLAPEAFPAAWQEHSARGRQCRNVQDKVTAVAQCPRLLDVEIPGLARDYDGVGLLRLRDRAVADDIWDDPETLAIMRPDEPRVFAGYVRNFALVACERVLRAGTETGCVLYGFLVRAPGLLREHFEAAWFAAPPGNAVGGIDASARRVVRNRVDAAPPGYAYDGVAEWWFDSASHLCAAFAGGAVTQHLPLVWRALIDPARSVFIAAGVSLWRGA